jgi:hypothetical protein
MAGVGVGVGVGVVRKYGRQGWHHGRLPLESGGRLCFFPDGRFCHPRLWGDAGLECRGKLLDSGHAVFLVPEDVTGGPPLLCLAHGAPRARRTGPGAT